MERRNKRTKGKGNGEGSIFFSEKLNCYIAQYVEPSGKRKTLKQRKKEKYLILKIGLRKQCLA